MFEFGEVEFIVLDVVLDATGSTDQYIDTTTDSVDCKGKMGIKGVIIDINV